MAKPKIDLPTPAAIRGMADKRGRLAIRVTPGARKEVLELSDAGLSIKIRAKPQDGEANVAVLKMLAQALGCATSRLQLLRGATGRDKLVQIPPE